jgi:pimeloyl-ACP methyl ester carboxylesterase
MSLRLGFLATAAVCALSIGGVAPAEPVQADTQAQETEAPVHEIVEVNGFSMAYRDVGEGEPLVLLHGFMGTGADLSGVLDDFTANYRVILPDLRGHGRSTNPDGTFTHRQAARDVFALLDQLGVDRFRGMGHSTGAMTLLHMATGQPERVEAVVLVAGTTYFPERAREIMRTVDPDAEPAEVIEERALQRGHVGGGEQLRGLMTLFRDFQHSYDDMNFTPPYLSTITAHTLIVHGDRDPFFPVSIPLEMYEAIPNSYLWIAPNSGHNVVMGSERGRRRFVETALDFLSGAWERR